MEQIYVELSIAIIAATAFAILLKLIRQPTIISYLLAGVIVGPSIMGLVHPTPALDTFAHIGVAFLLFIVGLNLNTNTLRDVGFVSLITGMGQVVFTTIIGYLITHYMLGFSVLASLYISLGITFSSTIIIVKLLSDKSDLETLYGKISVGFLIVQDLFAIFILMVISTMHAGENLLATATGAAAKILIIAFVLWFVGKFVFPGLLRFIASSQELLFLFSASWAFLLSILTSLLGFSIEIGALLAGITIASSDYHHEISSKVRSLRDFFTVLFFISLGAKLSFEAFGSVIFPAIILSIFILIGNPLIVMILMGILGYKKRTGFFAGLTVAQISEFSLILVVLGIKVGHLPAETLTLMTIVGILTIAGSTYLMIYNNQIYSMIARYLHVFEKKLPIKEESYRFHDKNASYEIVLFGYNRIGYSLVNTMHKLKSRFLVVDFNPETIKQLARRGVESIYGDASDTELMDEIGLSRTKMVISTIPDLDISLAIIKKAKDANPKCILMVTAHQVDDAIQLYDAGADYVIMPHFLGGERVSNIIENFGDDMGKFIEEKVRHLGELKARKEQGHDHPTRERHGR